MPDLHFTDTTVAHLYDLINPWGADNQFFVDLAGTSPITILDIGCGTGLLATALAERGHTVTGVDPAPGMLDVARHRPGGETVEWVASSSQDLRLHRTYDLIIITGHTFQVFLTDEELHATLLRVKEHLAPNGRVAFETRNPSVDWSSRWHGRDKRIDSPLGMVRETIEVVEADGRTLSFATRYELPTHRLTSNSTLRFLTLGEVEDRLAGAGLITHSLFGDWDSTPFTVESDEIIIVATHIR